MKLFDAFNQRAPNKVFFSIVLGALAGIAYSLLIPIVLTSIAPTDSRLPTVSRLNQTFLTFEIANAKLALLFAATCFFILIARSYSQIMLLRVSMNVATDLRVKIYQRIARAPINDLERLGPSKLLTLLTADVPRIIAGAKLLPDILVSIVTLIGMLGFLLLLNAAVFWFVVSAIFCGAIAYQIPMHFGNKYVMQSRDIADDLQESIRGLIYGAKELKLNQSKRESFFRDMLVANERKTLELEKRGFTIIRAAMNFGDLISFFVIGAVSFIFLNYHAMSNSELVGVIMALLYVTGPVGVLLNSVPQIFMSNFFLNRVEQVLNTLPEEDCGDTASAAPNWDTMHFTDVHYQYRRAGDGDGNGFQIGPINLEIKRGQITFIIGGNGSGKSTLSKLITLHYLPTSGQIHFGDTAVSPATLALCREEIGAIFTDYYLFDRLLGNINQETLARIDEYLIALQLQSKVSIKDGRFSTLKLSDGQRKRLALLVAFLEDKQLYLFDEWAADQDPTFKSVFYNKLLPDLKARNKAVIVISHDERYFSVADNLLVMDEGHLISNHVVTGAGSIAENAHIRRLDMN